VVEVSSLLLGLPSQVAGDLDQRRSCLALLRKGQGPDGGWGPYVNAPAEVFDTALALLALSGWPDRNEVEPMLERGRAYLLANQSQDGSWPETTRPTGGESYAQRLSTTGWAILALLATEQRPKKK
jgi:hypothetical protein